MAPAAKPVVRKNHIDLLLLMIRTLSLVTTTKRILSLMLLLVAVRLSAQQVVPVTAKLDPSFGDSGVEFTPFPNSLCFTVNCALPDVAGRTLIAARISCLSSVIMRYTANG